MDTFWKFLPYLIKLAMALVGTSWGAVNVAMSQVGAGANLAQDWWKILLPLAVGGVGAVTSVTHHYGAVKEAQHEPPPVTIPPGPAGLTTDAVSLEYLGRIGAAMIKKGDTVGQIRVAKLSAHMNNKPIPTTDELTKS